VTPSSSSRASPTPSHVSGSHWAASTSSSASTSYAPWGPLPGTSTPTQCPSSRGLDASPGSARALHHHLHLSTCWPLLQVPSPGPCWTDCSSSMGRSLRSRRGCHPRGHTTIGFICYPVRLLWRFAPTGTPNFRRTSSSGSAPLCSIRASFDPPRPRSRRRSCWSGRRTAPGASASTTVR